MRTDYSKEVEIIYPFWEIPSFVGNNLIDMVTCPIGIDSKGFFCKVKVRSSAAKEKLIEVNGFFDTGASRTCISKRVIEILNPEKNGQSVYTVFEGGYRIVDKYKVDVFIENVNSEFQINALSAPDNDRGIDVIIGLDIICLGELSITKDIEGKSVLKFDDPVLPK